MILYLHKIQKGDDKQLIKSVVGMNIRQARKRKKMTQKQLADALEYSESSICKYEQGLVEIPLVIIERIANILEVDSSELLDSTTWEDEFNSVQVAKEVKVIEELEDVFGKDAVEILSMFTELNSDGKQKALERIYEMTEIPRYTRKDSD